LEQGLIVYRFQIIGAFAATLLSTLTLTDAARAEPLEALLIQLLATHPQIQNQRAQVESARKAVERARAGYLPVVEVSGAVGPAYIETDVRSQSGQPPFEATQQVARLNITQNVFDGYSTSSQVKIARLNTDVTRLTLDGIQQNILFEGISAYLDVLRQSDLIALARLSEDSIMRQAELEDERVERGSGITVDVLQAKSRLQIAKERRVSFEGELQNSISRFLQVFNALPQLEAMSVPTPPLAALPPNLDAAVDNASDNNPAVGSSLATIEVASERRRLARSDYFPRVDIVGSANHERNFDLLPGVRNDVSVVLMATWQLFDGFATRANVAQTAYDYQASRDNHTSSVRTVVESTRLAWQQLVTARQRADLLENAVGIAGEVFAARAQLREAGNETVINVLIAEDEVNNARINLTIARYDAILAAYQLLLATGRLDLETLGIRG
jgi:outer membrane protein, adhesin transport system